MPLVGGRNRISISRSHSFADSGSPLPERGEYFFAALQDSDPFNQLQGVDTATDSSLNVYALGKYAQGGFGPGPFSYYLVKYDKDGNLLWQFQLGDPGTGTSFEPYKVRVHPDGNVIVAGRVNADSMIIKVSPAGALVWQSAFQVNSAGYFAKGMVIKSNGEIVIAGGGFGNQAITRMDATGALIGNATGINTAGNAIDVAIDSNGNIVTVASDTVGVATGAVITWLDSGLNVFRQRYLSNPVYCDGLGVACDASGNVYVTGLSDEAGDTATYVAKYDVTGTLQYIKAIQATLPAQLMLPTGIVVQSNGTTYVLAYSVVSGQYQQIMIKLDNAGNLLFARDIGFSGDNDESSDIRLDVLDDVYISGYVTFGGSGQTMVTGKIPNDGSLTGTYALFSTTFVYQAFTDLTVGASLTIGDTSSNSSGFGANNPLALTGNDTAPTYADDTVIL